MPSTTVAACQRGRRRHRGLGTVADVPRTRWEYTILTFKTSGSEWIEGFVTGLALEGADGWESVGVVHQSEGVAHLLMKRPK
jgi:hypothetical protein